MKYVCYSENCTKIDLKNNISYELTVIVKKRTIYNNRLIIGNTYKALLSKQHQFNKLRTIVLKSFENINSEEKECIDVFNINGLYFHKCYTIVSIDKIGDFYI